ncbi:MAG: type II secretion system inner membrane protein GspF [Xanthomonadales bacterium]|nr:type II secretion system inner membrane protein GspF [Xanthomonadales bacterium]MBP6692636.1 type II secretion system inner membrane protein GspF [Xanthomonadales bacterium]MBP7418536.1 type II secretion system inner membrane protein GspF [Xanthomonadales bacterium]
MALFRYKAVASTGETIEGQMEATSREEVIGRLQEGGNIPIEAREAAAGAGSGLSALFRRADLNQGEIVVFTQQLAVLLGAGQPLDRALQILLELPDSERAKKLLERVRESVRGGTPLSSALEQQHGVFSRLYVNMVRAGEASGSLQETLRRLAEYLERSRAMREGVVSALIYPAILLVLVVGALALLLIYVVPQFVPLFEDMGVELPLITRFVLAMGDFLAGWWWVMAAAAAGFVLWAQNQLQQPRSRLAFDTRLLGARWIGGLVAKIETARLARTLGTLLTNGVPLLTSLAIGRNVLGNAALVAAVDAAADEVKTGGGLAWALGRSKRFPSLALQMISVGEESGELDGMLLKVADTFDGEVKRSIDRSLAALVPMLTIVMALLVAFIMLAILLPILDLSRNIQ